MWTLDVEQASLSRPKAVQPGPPRQASHIDWLKLMETDSFIYFLRRWHLRKCSPQQGVAEAGQKALSPNTTWGSPQTISSKVITLPPPFPLTFPSSSVHAPRPQQKYRRFCCTEKPCRIHNLAFAFYFSSTSMIPVAHRWSWPLPWLSIFVFFFFKARHWKRQSVILLTTGLPPHSEPQTFPSFSLVLPFPTPYPLGASDGNSPIVSGAHCLSTSISIHAAHFTFIFPLQTRHSEWKS